MSNKNNIMNTIICENCAESFESEYSKTLYCYKCQEEFIVDVEHEDYNNDRD